MSVTKEQFAEYVRLEDAILTAAAPVMAAVAAIRNQSYPADRASLTVDGDNIQASWYSSSNDYFLWIPASYLWIDWQPIEEETIRKAQEEKTRQAEASRQSTERHERAVFARLKQKYEPQPEEEAAK